MTLTPIAVNNAIDELPLVGKSWAPATKPLAALSLVHGLGEHCGRYEGLAAALGAKGIAVTALDLHGHGQSGGKRGVCSDYLLLHGDVDAILDQSRALYPDVPQFLMGHSMGGNIVLSYGLLHPDEDIAGVISQAALIDVPKPAPALLQFIMKLIVKIFPTVSLKAKLDGTKISTLKDEQVKYEVVPLNHTRLGGRLAIDLLAAGRNISDAASGFAYDVLVTHGTKDELTLYSASESFAQDAPKSTFISYEDSAHEVHNDIHRDQVYADLSGWILKRI